MPLAQHQVTNKGVQPFICNIAQQAETYSRPIPQPSPTTMMTSTHNHTMPRTQKASASWCVLPEGGARLSVVSQTKSYSLDSSALLSVRPFATINAQEAGT